MTPPTAAEARRFQTAEGVHLQSCTGKRAGTQWQRACLRGSTSASGKRPALHSLRVPREAQPAGCAGARQQRPRCSAAALCRFPLRRTASQRGAPTRRAVSWPPLLLRDGVSSRRLRATRRSALASPPQLRLLCRWRHDCRARSRGGLLPQLVGNAARGAPPAALRRCGAAAARALHPGKGGGWRG